MAIDWDLNRVHGLACDHFGAATEEVSLIADAELVGAHRDKLGDPVMRVEYY